MHSFGVLFAILFIAASSTGGRAGNPAARLEPQVTTDSARHDDVMLASGEVNVSSEYCVSQEYHSDGPAVLFELPDRLRENSDDTYAGIEYLEDGSPAAVKDGRGRVYLIDPSAGDVLKHIGFGKKGDYEDVKAASERPHVLRSTGTLFRLEGGRRQGGAEVLEVKTGLRGTCDAEELACGELQRRLIIACKEDPGKDSRGERACYASNVAAGTLQENPEIRIRFNEAERTAWDNLGGKAKDVNPSAIAFHPSTLELDVLSTVLMSAMVLAPSGEIRRMSPLDDERIPQPEGPAFTHGGDLWISNEGPKDQATHPGFAYRDTL